MTTKTISPQRLNSKFLKYIFHRIIMMKTRMVLLCVFGALSFPLMALSLTLDEYNQNNVNGFLVISAILFFISIGGYFIVMFSNALNGFGYLNRREEVDMGYCLPVSDKAKFWGDFLAGIVPLCAVYIASFLLGFLIILPNADNIFNDFSNTYSLNGPLAATSSVILTYLVFLIMTYSAAVFAVSYCGRIFEAAVNTILICAVVPSLIALAIVMPFISVWQLKMEIPLEYALAGTSPGGLLVVTFAYLFSYDSNLNIHSNSILNSIALYQPYVFIPVILITAAFAVGAYLLYKRRKAENVGKAFAFKHVSNIVLGILMFCLTGFFATIIKNAHDNSYYSNDTMQEAWLGMFISTAVLFLFIDVTAKRGFKKMGKAALRYIVMMAGSGILSVILLSLNGFGAGEYIPPTDEIESVSTDVLRHFSHYNDTYFSFSYGTANGFTTSSPPNSGFAEFSDKDSIELIRQLNVASNNEKKNELYSEVHYKLKNGRTIIRKIILNLDGVKPLLHLATGEEFKNSYLKYLDLSANHNNNEPKGIIMMTLDNFSSYRNYPYDENPDIYKPEAASKLFEAFKTDILNETYEQMYFSDEKCPGIIEIIFDAHESFDKNGINTKNNTFRTNNFKFTVRSHYKNVLRVLEEYGLEFPEIKSEERVATLEHRYVLSTPNISFHIDDYSSRGRTVIKGEDLIKLMEVIQPFYYTDGEAYVLSYDYIIPETYKDMAEEIFDRAVKENVVKEP